MVEKIAVVGCYCDLFYTPSKYCAPSRKPCCAPSRKPAEKFYQKETGVRDYCSVFRLLPIALEYSIDFRPGVVSSDCYLALASNRLKKYSSPLLAAWLRQHFSLNFIVIQPLISGFGHSSTTAQTDQQTGVFLASLNYRYRR
jgi:hypothetical protein